MSDQDGRGNDDKPMAADGADQQVVVFPPEAVQEAAKKNIPLTITISSSTSHSGPLPPPAMLNQYNEVIPGLANTLVDELKAESAHRRRTQRIGQVGAIAVAVLSIICDMALGMYLKSPYAALSIIAPVCGIVGTAQLLQLWLKP